MLSIKQRGINYYFWVFDLTLPGIEHRSPRTLVYVWVFERVCVCVHKQELALNNPQVLLCHKTQPNQTIHCHSNRLAEIKTKKTSYRTLWGACGAMVIVDKNGRVSWVQILYEFGFGVCWVLWHINLCRLFNAKSIFM